MAKMNDLKLVLPTIEDLFSTQETRDDEKREKVMDIPLSLIDDFPNHPFKVIINDSLYDMAESIKAHGVLVPILIRTKSEGRYEMVAGHRRKKGSEIAEKDSIPAIIRELTDEEAIIIMVDSNLQREKILPSEKAFAYKMKLEALNKQGKRTDLSSTPLESKFRTNEVVGAENGESREQVRRYIRLTELIPKILDMVDEEKIAFRPAVEISYLKKVEQEMLFETMECEVCTPSLAQALKMKKLSQEDNLDEDSIFAILKEEKANQKEQVKIAKERINMYFPIGTPPKIMEDTIVKALELYYKQRGIEKEGEPIG